jgi:hypothetical protein
VHSPDSPHVQFSPVQEHPSPQEHVASSEQSHAIPCFISPHAIPCPSEPQHPCPSEPQEDS